LIIFQGSPFDIYIHWLILLLGIGVLISGVAVLTSCRSIAETFNLLKEDTSPGARFYRGFYKHHGIYWSIFWYVLILHLMVTIAHVKLPVDGEPFLLSHQVAFYTSISNLVLTLAVFSSCKSAAWVLNFFTNRSPLGNKGFKQFYKYHSYYWWLLALSVTVHIVSGVIHAVNT
jgi:hypothetical protein